MRASPPLALNRAAGLLGLFVVCLLLARVVAAGEAPESGGVAPAALLLIGALLAAHLALVGAEISFAVLVALSASGLADTNAAIATIAGAQITPVDIVFVVVAAQAFFTDAAWKTTRSPLSGASRAGLAVIALMGASVIAQVFNGTSTDVSLTSWLRIVQAAVVALLAARLLTSPRAVTRVLGGVVAGGLVLVGQMIFQVIAEGGNPLTGRFGGPVNQDAAGLVAAAMLVVAIAYPAFSSRVRVVTVVAALIGLFLAKSIGTLLSVAVVLGALAASREVARPGAVKALRLGVVAGVAAILVFGVLHSARSEALPSSAQFGSSTISHRIVVGAAGLELFVRNPLLGVGWQRSAAPEVIGDEAINASLRERFPQVAPYFYPDVTPASVHSAYIQVLAELGTLGGVLVIVFVVLLGRAAWRLLKEHGSGDALHPQLVTVIALGGLVVLWWNENPLYGGQFETLSFSVALGMLIALSRSRPEPDPA